MKLRCDDGVVREFSPSTADGWRGAERSQEAECKNCGEEFGIHDLKVLKPMFRRHVCAVGTPLLPRSGKAQEWHPLSDKPTVFESVLISDPPEHPASSRMPTMGLAHVNKQGEWCTMRNGKSEPIHPSHLRNTKWMVWPYPPPEEECGYCGGTGEVACSSTNYMSCPACSKENK
jgi:hypothetical protein